MPTLVLEDMPADVYERLRRLAEVNQQPMAVEAIRLLRGLLPDEPFLTGEIPAPFDLPRPGTGVAVIARAGGVRLPDPPALVEES